MNHLPPAASLAMSVNKMRKKVIESNRTKKKLWAQKFLMCFRRHRLSRQEEDEKEHSSAKGCGKHCEVSNFRAFPGFGQSSVFEVPQVGKVWALEYQQELLEQYIVAEDGGAVQELLPAFIPTHTGRILHSFPTQHHPAPTLHPPQPTPAESCTVPTPHHPAPIPHSSQPI